MKIEAGRMGPMKKPATTSPGPAGGSRGFALIELLVILVVVAMFAAVTLPALLAAREPVLRAQCVNNLRQIAVGWSIYQQEFNQVMPCHWPGYTDSSGTSNPWRTYEAYRVVPGTGQIITDAPAAGPWNLGVLFATSLVPGPRLFYCPATARVNRTFGYDYYATISNTWPSTPVGSGDDKIRTSYNYYPQLRALAPSGYQGKLVPKPAYTPTKWADLDGKKSIATDLVTSTGSMGHRASGSVAGLNALFPDGRVVFQTPHNNPEPFDPNLWDPGGVIIGNSAPEFRYVMSLWKP
jgi:type II secretory pathway pseudopilin PulG